MNWATTSTFAEKLKLENKILSDLILENYAETNRYVIGVAAKSGTILFYKF